MWTEDNVSIYRSENCVVRRGLLDGNNSPTGVGVMFENVSSGLVEDVDTIRQGNGSFSAWTSQNVIFRRTRARENICADQGRGKPSSGAQIWVGGGSSMNLRNGALFTAGGTRGVFDLTDGSVQVLGLSYATRFDPATDVWTRLPADMLVVANIGKSNAPAAQTYTRSQFRRWAHGRLSSIDASASPSGISARLVVLARAAAAPTALSGSSTLAANRR